jgi:LuxR family transcriptional regulator, regulator of acetate metabolism
MATRRTTADIATALTLSIETVRNHIRAVMRELNTHTRSEALVVARQLGLLATPPLGPPSGGA